MWEEILHEFLHALQDTAKMLPFLFVAYLLIEYIEHRKSDAIEGVLRGGGRFGFIPGALLGAIPQCGFSAMASNFYASRVVTLGTMIAVFVATSDEAIPILISRPGRYGDMLLLIGIKIVYAILIGFLIDFVLTRFLPRSLKGGYDGEAEHVDCHKEDGHRGIFLSALLHTLNIFLVVLAFTFAFGLLVEWIGAVRISQAMNGMGFFQPLVAGLLGLVPNCASSVLLTQLYLANTISFGSLLAGLSTNAGIGLTVLFRANRNIKQNLFIVGLLYLCGIVLGLVVHATGL